MAFNLGGFLKNNPELVSAGIGLTGRLLQGTPKSPAPAPEELQYRRDIALQQFDPQQDAQNYQQRLLQAALLRNATPFSGLQNLPPEIAATMPKFSGGMSIPADLAQSVLSNQAINAAYGMRNADRQQVNPKAQVMGGEGYLGGVAPGAQQGGAGATIPKGYEVDKKTGQLKKKGGGIGGFFKKVGKVALAAAPIIAAPFTGGASLLAIGAGAGAASGALGGGGWKGALMGGAMGAIPGGGAAAKGAGSIAKAVAMNPNVWSAAVPEKYQGIANMAGTGMNIANMIRGAGQGAAGSVKNADLNEANWGGKEFSPYLGNMEGMNESYASSIPRPPVATAAQNWQLPTDDYLSPQAWDTAPAQSAAVRPRVLPPTSAVRTPPFVPQARNPWAGAQGIGPVNPVPWRGAQTNQTINPSNAGNTAAILRAILSR